MVRCVAGPTLRPTTLVGRSPEAQRQLVAAFADAWETAVLSPERIRTGCLYEGQPASTYSIAVMRFDPRLSGRQQIPFHEWWPELAPSAPLLNAYRRLDTHGQHALPWPAFAHAYLAELDGLPTALLLGLIQTLCEMPSRYTTVTLLCCEHATAAD